MRRHLVLSTVLAFLATALPAATPSTIRIASEDEPGTPLVVAGTI